MPIARFSRPFSLRVTGLSAALVLSLVAGCGGERKEAKQIEKAKQTVAALTADGTFAHINDKYRRDELEKIYKDVKTIADSGADNLKAAAFTVTSRAKAGIAVLDAKAAAAADAALTTQLTAFAAAANTYTLQKSIAETNNGVGTQGLIKTLQSSLEANRKNAADAAKAAAKVQATVDELDTRAKQIASQAQAKRDEASSLASTAQNGTATQGLEVLKNAATVRAQADALEHQHAELSTQLGLAQAELSRARAAAAALEDQSKQIQATITSAQTRLEEERKLADTASKAADAAAGEVKKAFADLNTFRSGELDKTHQDAVSSAKNALEHAKQAAAKGAANKDSVGGGNTGKLSVAAMNQAYADALVSQARAEDQLAGALAMVAGAKPALPNADEVAKSADAARKSADDNLAKAREVYAEVKTQIDAIGEEKLKSRLEQTSHLLEALSSKQGVQAEPALAPAPAPSGTDKPAAAAAAADSPEVVAVKKAIDQVMDKLRSGDVAGINNELTAFDNDQQRESANALVELQALSAAFEKACQEKLNASSKEVLGPMAAMAGGLGQTAGAGEALKNMTAADFKVTVNGETAAASAGSGPGFKFIKRDGKWLLKGGLLGDAPPMNARMLASVKSVLKEVTDDINSGKITSAQQVQTTLMAKMGGMMNQGGGGGGGGGDEDPNK